MQVRRVKDSLTGNLCFELLDDTGQSVVPVQNFLQHLQARDYSPHTLSAYAYDLLHFFTFLQEQSLNWQAFTPAHSLAFLEFLRSLPGRHPTKRLQLVLCTTANGQSATPLSPTSINRILAAVSSFYEYLLVSAQLPTLENPLQKTLDPALARVSERHRPFMGSASRQSPLRRVVRVKTIQRLPRPIEDDQVQQLLNSLKLKRDQAMLVLMWQGGLRPGEVLNLHLEDIQYGRRRVVIRYRTNHPHGVRTKSRTERVVDLHEPEALQLLSQYVMLERPQEASISLVFLVGGRGQKRCEALSYHALVKLFARHCQKLGIRQPWLTPHALRHSHATKMWEGGMRELALQKRLGHASPESTRLYTRVSEAVVVAEYRQALIETQQQKGEVEQ